MLKKKLTLILGFLPGPTASGFPRGGSGAALWLVLAGGLLFLPPAVFSQTANNDYAVPTATTQEKQVLQVPVATAGPASVTGAAATAAASSVPPPTGLANLLLKEGVYLSWNAAPAQGPVVGYEVYRSRMPGFGYRLLNPKPLNAPYFLDGAGTNLPAPENGDDYFYVVASIDAQGNVSAFSDELAVTPQGLDIPAPPGVLETPTPTPTPAEETELKIPDQNLFKFQLPADSQLSIQGYKQIEADFTFQHFDRPDGLNGLSANSNSTNVNQELVVNLDGKVGQNVDVHVDYSDVNRTGGLDQTQQQISIVYHGDENSPVQEVSFGDLNLVLPNTEFAGFNKQLFGIQSKLKFDDLRVTSFFAQTKGLSETKVFKGNQVQVNLTLNDIQFIPYKYFMMTKSVNNQTLNGQVVNVDLPQNGTEQIWVDPGTGQLPPQSANYIGPFQKFLPGRDYTIDYTTGIVTFITPVNISSRIAVAFVQQDGQRVGEDVNGNILDLNQPINNPNLTVPPGGMMKPGPNQPHLIKDNSNPADVSALYLLNYFSLGTVPIVPPNQDPNFSFQIINQGTNSVVQTGTAVGARWSVNVNTDLNLLVVTDTQNASFPERPFANPPPDNTNGTGPNDVYSQTTVPTSLYRMQLVYDTRQNFFNMGRFNILLGSETVYLDGRLLHRDTDYSFDYTSGNLDFVNKNILLPDSQVVVTYEYSPFGAFAQENILGTRAEYDVTDHFFLGSTFLYSGTQQPTDVPQIGSEPNDLAIIDADARFDVDRNSVKALTSLIPGLENWTPPLSLQLSGEVAKSFYDPNTFDTEGETGVAMIDNMDGIDSATNLSVNATSWLVSPPPESVPAFLGPTTYDGSSNASTNNRARFFNYNNGFQFQTISEQEMTNGTTSPPGVTVPGAGGHIYATTKVGTDIVSVLEFPYSNLTNQRWAGLKQTLSTLGTDLSNTVFFESWIYNDGQDKWIMADFGSFAEDTNGNGILDQDTTVDANGVTIPNQAHPNPAYGIPSFYFTNPLAGPGILQAITGISTETTSTQEGVGTDVFITEDQNSDNTLDGADAYFEYGIHANWNGWKEVKIPVNLPANTAPPPDSTNTTDAGVNYFFHSVGVPNSQVVRSVRLWTTGNSAAAQDGYFLLESMAFTHNLWQLQVDPTANVDQGVTVNTSKFDVTTVNQPINSSYNPTLRFVTLTQGEDQSSITAKESALQINYNLSSTDFDPPGNINGRPIYYATRTFSQTLDFTIYSQMRFDLEAVSFSPGDVLFVRLGNDQQDYYQYNIPLTTAYQNLLWKSVIIDLDGSDGNRSTFGTPFINRVSQISFGVLSPNAPTATTNELWINNLRTTNPISRAGVARRANATLLVGDNFATINARYREVDSGFTQLDQQATRFQHSTQLGADYSSNAVSLFSQPLVTQFSYTHQDTYTEAADTSNPNFELLPNSYVDSTTGSIGYTKDLGPSFGRFTSVRISESTNEEKDRYEDVYLSQPGVQGNTNKAEQIVALASTYDAPNQIFSIPIGTNQFTETFSITHDSQDFNIAEGVTFPDLYNYDRTTRNQVYGWTNTTELIKNLVISPGYTLTLVDAVGNTNTPGMPTTMFYQNYTPFQNRYQPTAGVVYRGIPGLIPSVNYTGSVQYDYVSFPQPQFTNANSINYLLSFTPASWLPFLQKTNLSVDAGRTESSNATIQSINPNSFQASQPLDFDQTWLVSRPVTQDYLGSETITDRLNASFNILDGWDMRPTGSWGETLSVVALGTNPTTQDINTFGFTTVWSKKLFTLPLINLNINSAQVQFTRTQNYQYDSNNNPFLLSNSDVISLVLPYDIDKGAQGNIRIQYTRGDQTSQGVYTSMQDDQYSIEYNQKFLDNQTIHVPFTHWKIKLENPLEARLVLLAELINNQSSYSYNQLVTQRYNGTLSLNYNALKNLRVGIGFTYEHLNNYYAPTLGYDLVEATVSGEARF